jgi:hypothetical protein
MLEIITGIIRYTNSDHNKPNEIENPSLSLTGRQMLTKHSKPKDKTSK